MVLLRCWCHFSLKYHHWLTDCLTDWMAEEQQKRLVGLLGLEINSLAWFTTSQHKGICVKRQRRGLEWLRRRRRQTHHQFAAALSKISSMAIRPNNPPLLLIWAVTTLAVGLLWLKWRRRLLLMLLLLFSSFIIVVVVITDTAVGISLSLLITR